MLTVPLKAARKTGLVFSTNRFLRLHLASRIFEGLNGMIHHSLNSPAVLSKAGGRGGMFLALFLLTRLGKQVRDLDKVVSCAYSSC